MSRIHAALVRASDGQAPILPAEVDAATGQGGEPIQPAFVAPWTLDAASPEPPDAAVEPGGDSVPGDGAAAGVPSVITWSPAVRAPSSEDVAEKLVTWPAGDDQVALAIGVEQYRKLAAGLHRAQGERGMKVVMVTSSGPGEGKSLTAANLALTFAESYHRRVLLIDADLRQPSLHEILEVSNTVGLAEGLASTDATPVRAVELSPHLCLLPSGRPQEDPTAGLTSERMRLLLEDARKAFDWIVVDTPPVGLLTDAKLLSDMTDGVLLVIDAQQNSYPDLQRAVADLGRERVLGVVMNKYQPAGPGSYYHGYGARYRRVGKA